MRYELFLALRYLGGLRRQQPFVSVIAAISVLGIALGVAALLVVLAVMSGFDADLETRIVGSNPHLVVEADGGMADAEVLVHRLLKIPGVVAASPFLQTQVLLEMEGQAAGVILRGVDPAREPQVTGLVRSMGKDSWPPEPGELILGSELARRWGLQAGDSVTVIGAGKGKAARHPATVRGLFTTGMYEYDRNLALTSIETVQTLLGLGTVSGVGVRLESALKAPEIKRVISQELKYPYWVVSWMDLNQNLFSALKLEKLVMFIILTLIVLVACFNIVATLLMMVVGRIKEIGILRAIGATGVSVRRVFTWAGLLIGSCGTLAGAAVGVTLCWALARYQFVQLPPEIYYLDHLPVKLEWADAMKVTGAALGISWAACLYPAWVAARLQPADAIRYE